MEFYMKKYLFYVLMVFVLFSCDIIKDTVNLEEQVDSDGDGYTDNEEINEYLHSMEINPVKFNPFIADIPDISFEMITMPVINVNVINESDETITLSTSDSSNNETSYSTTQTSSTAITNSHSANISIKAEASWTGSSVSTEANYEESYSKEVTNTHSTSSSQLWSSTHQKGMEHAKEVSQTQQSGKISVNMRIKNTGHIAYTLQSITLEALTFSPYDSTPYKPIANLTYEGDFSSTTIGVNKSIGGNFSSEIFAQTALDLLKNPSSIVVRIASYEIVDENGRSFTHNDTEIEAKCFTLMIDYGVNESIAPEIYKISDADENSSLDLIFKNILGMNDFIEDGTKLTKVRSLSADPKTGGWMIIHTYSDNYKGKKIYSPVEDYSLAEIKPNRGDKVIVMYVEDKDLDGVLAGVEFAYGTDDNKKDSDGDGVSDYDEIKSGSNAIRCNKPEDVIGLNINYNSPFSYVVPSEDVSFFGNDRTGEGVIIAKSKVNISTNWKIDETMNLPSNINVYILRSEAPIGYPLVNGVEYNSGDTTLDNIDIIYSGNSILLNNTGNSILDENIKYNTKYYYKVFTKFMDTGIFSYGIEKEINTDIKVDINLTKFTISNLKDEYQPTDAEFLWWIQIKPLRNDSIYIGFDDVIISKNTDNYCVLNTDIKEHDILKIDGYSFSKQSLIIPYLDPSSRHDNNLFYIHTNVQENDHTFDYDHEKLIWLDKGITWEQIKPNLETPIKYEIINTNNNQDKGESADNILNMTFELTYPKDDYINNLID